MTKVTHGDGTEENYAYDNAGNILTFNNGSTQNHTLAYGDTHGWKDLLTEVDGNAITYDTIGNPLSYYNGYTFNWTEGRKLQSVSTGENQTTSYSYDANGLRIRKTNPDGSYIYYHVLNGRYLGETHYNALNQRVKYLRYTYDENDTVCGIGIWYAGHSHAWEEYYFEKNLQGDVIAVYTAANGENGLPQLVASYTYDAWGNILSATDADGNDARTTPGTVANINPFRYRGYYYDTETKFYYLQSRYYEPAIGRFVNADGLASTGQGVVGHNMFAYCGNNPVSRCDMEGTRYCAATSVSKESAYDRSYSCYWQKQVTLEKYNPNPIGEYSGGKVYLITDDDKMYARFPGDVIIQDARGSGEDHNVTISFSNQIQNKDMQKEIVSLLLAYELQNPTGWYRTEDSMMLEWDVHNKGAWLGQLIPFQNELFDKSIHVAFDNKSEGWSKWDHCVDALKKLIFH